MHQVHLQLLKIIWIAKQCNYWHICWSRVWFQWQRPRERFVYCSDTETDGNFHWNVHTCYWHWYLYRSRQCEWTVRLGHGDALLVDLFHVSFFSKFLEDISPFVGPPNSFWSSGDVSSGFQSHSGQPYSRLAEAYVFHVSVYHPKPYFTNFPK